MEKIFLHWMYYASIIRNVQKGNALSITNDVEILIAQTEFLLTQQKESKNYTLEKFLNFVEYVEQKSDEQTKKGNVEGAKKLQEIAGIMRNQVDVYEDNVDEDIDYLEQQRDALTQLQGKSESEVKSFLDEVLQGESLQPMEVFKKDVMREAHESRESFLKVLNDLQTTLDEGSIDDLFAYVQGMYEDMQGEESEREEGLELEMMEENDDDETSDFPEGEG